MPTRKLEQPKHAPTCPLKHRFEWSSADDWQSLTCASCTIPFENNFHWVCALCPQRLHICGNCGNNDPGQIKLKRGDHNLWTEFIDLFTLKKYFFCPVLGKTTWELPSETTGKLRLKKGYKQPPKPEVVEPAPYVPTGGAAAILRPSAGGPHVCMACGGKFSQCHGSYGMRNQGSVWSAEVSDDLTKLPESPNTKWCCQECEGVGYSAWVEEYDKKPKETPEQWLRRLASFQGKAPSLCRYFKKGCRHRKNCKFIHLPAHPSKLPSDLSPFRLDEEVVKMVVSLLRVEGYTGKPNTISSDELDKLFERTYEANVTPFGKSGKKRVLSWLRQCRPYGIAERPGIMPSFYLVPPPNTPSGDEEKQAEGWAFEDDILPVLLKDGGHVKKHLALQPHDCLRKSMNEYGVNIKSKMNISGPFLGWLKEREDVAVTKGGGIYLLPMSDLQVRALHNRRRNAQALASEKKRRTKYYSQSMGTLKLVETLRLPSSYKNKIGELRAMQERLVGFDNVNEYIDTICDDALGRALIGEPRLLRHVLISGNSGSGKRTAARLLSNWFVLTSPRRKDESYVEDANPIFKVGDLVRIRSVSVDEAKRLQNGHGGWVPTMEEKFGSVAPVTSVSGKSCVSVVGYTWNRALIEAVHDSVLSDSDDESDKSDKRPVFPAVGSQCMLAPDYQNIGDAKYGPLKPGVIYVVESETSNGKRSESSNGKMIRVVGHSWVYHMRALRPVSKGMQNDVREVQSIDDLDDSLKILKPGESIYFAHKTMEVDPKKIFKKDELMKLSALFAAATQKQVRIFFGGSEASIDVLRGLPCFRKFEASLLELKSFSVSSLAKISLMKLDELGYTLWLDDKTRNEYSTMKHIVRLKYKVKQMEERNAYLAADCIDQAISRKNRRLMAQEEDALRFPMGLSSADFDVKTVSAKERNEMRAAIEQKISNVAGWGTASEEDSPLRWFQAVRTIIFEAEKDEQENGDLTMAANPDGVAPDSLPTLRRFESIATSRTALQPWEFNVVVEGLPGTGKKMFTEYATEFLRAYGLLSRGSVTTEIQGDSLLENALDNISGGILISSAEKMVPRTDVRNDNSGVDSGASNPTEVIMSVSSRTDTFVALSCAPAEGNGLLNTFPTLRNRFPFRVVLSVPPAKTLAGLAASYARDTRGFEFQEGLEEELSMHILDSFGKEPEGGIRFIHGLVDTAIRRSYERRATKLNEDTATEVEKRNISDHRLRACDFEIGKEIGDPEMLREVYEEVDGLIGMESAKKWLRQFANQVRMSNLTGDKTGLNMSYNLVLTGAPGTGKTTFARMIHKFYKAHGVIKGEFVEKNALEMKGEYVGSTTPLVKAAMKAAKGGTLFLDEAYGLAGDDRGNDSFSKEAIRTLLTEVENNRTSTIVIMAGYKDKMQRFMREDPGLPRRFPNTLDLENYSPLELAKIASYVARRRFKKEFEPGLEEKLAKHFSMQYRRQMAEENGGLAVNATEKAQQNVSHRVFEALRKQELLDGDEHVSSGDKKRFTAEQKLAVAEQVKVITAEDFGISGVGEDGSLGASAAVKADVEETVKNLVAMDNVKSFFNAIKATARLVEQTGNDSALQSCLNLVLTGNPGVGKSTTARIIQRYLHAYGILQTNHFREVNALHLKGQYMGQTSHRVSEIVKDALGGCLFIDEAYSLVQDGGDTYGREVIRTLLTEVENHRSDLLVILAGYEQPMQDLLDADAGLRRRFATTIHLRDYTGLELANIAVKKAEEKKYVIEPDVVSTLGAHIEDCWADEMKIMNGGLSVNLVEAAIGRLAVRLRELSGEEMRVQGATLQAIDLCHAPKTKMKKKTSNRKVTNDDVDSFVRSALAANGLSDRAAEIVQTLSTNSIAQVNILSRLTDRDWEKMGVNIGERIALQVALETQAPDL